MTKTQFVIECNTRLIAPAIALENDSIVKALATRDDEKVLQILDTEF